MIEYKFADLFSKPFINKLHTIVIAIMIVLTFVIGDGKHWISNVIFVTMLVYIGYFFIYRRNHNKHKNSIRQMLSIIIEDLGIYTERSYSKDGEKTRIAPYVIYKEDLEKIYINIIAQDGLDVEKVKIAGEFLENSMGYKLLKTSNEYNNVEFMFNKKDMEVSIDHIYDVGEFPILGFDEMGQAVQWEFPQNPHLGVYARAGAGKSVFVKQVIKQLAEISDELVFVDFKEVEFGPLERLGYTVYTSLEEGFMDGLKDFHKKMNEQNKIIREKGANNFKDAGLKPKFMIFDEFASLSDSFADDKEGKADRKEFYRLIGDIARRGRSIGFNLVIVTQRPDASIIPGEIRNNIATNAVMRAGDPETRNMAFNDRMSEQTQLPIGYALVNDDSAGEIKTVRVPFYEPDNFVNDMRKENLGG